MGWASRHIERLRAGETVRFRPRGRSMRGRIEDGQPCTVRPIRGEPAVGDVVLCTVRGEDYLHLVKARRPDGRFQIGNNVGGVNGWIGLGAIHGLVVEVGD